MNKISFFFLLLCSITMTLLSGCYTYFEPNLESTPVVCLNSLITAGKEIKVEVTRTWRYSEGNPAVGLDIYLINAEVSLYVNDNFEERLELITDTENRRGVNSFYTAKYIPKCGDIIKIVAVDETYGEAEAEVTIPYPVEIDEVKVNITKNKAAFDKESDTFSSTFDMMLNVSFTDPASDRNYYVFDMQTYGSILYELDGETYFVPIAEKAYLYPDYSFEPIFSEHITPIETIISDGYGLYTVFSDRQFSGKQYSLSIPVHGSYECDYAHHPDLDNKLTMDIMFNHISTPYYNYMLSLWAETEGISGALGGVGLGDAVFEFSNVSTGAGIVATQAQSVFKLNMHDLLNPE